MSEHRLRVIITDYDYPTVDLERTILEAVGAELAPRQLRSEEALIAACRTADALLNQYAPLTERVFASLERCRAVVRYGVGVDHIDLAAATRHGVLVCNVPDYCVEEASDHALTLLLALLRRAVLLDHLVRQGVWDVTRAGTVQRLAGQVLGIVGLGRVGTALARKARVLGLEAIAYDPYKPDERFAEVGARRVELDELLEQADAVSLHVPLTPHTRHLIGEAELRRLRPNAVLVNTSRGQVVDELAVARALADNRLAGAALDVLEVEPIPPEHPLLSLDNVILTPHAAWFSERSYVTLKTMAAEEVVRVLRGELPRCPLNPEVLARGGIGGRPA